MEYMKPLKFFKQLMRHASTKKPYERFRVLGVDIGFQYVNVAVSSQDNTTAVPLWHHCAAHSQISNDEEVGLLGDKLQTLIADYNAMGLVIGYGYPYRFPYTMDRDWAISVMRVVEQLQKTGKLERVKYTYWDDLIPTQFFVLTGYGCFNKASRGIYMQEFECAPRCCKGNYEKVFCYSSSAGNYLFTVQLFFFF
ncbi:hypothetical protein ACOSQ2_020415 [Xanthoceras sorbifolium]